MSEFKREVRYTVIKHNQLTDAQTGFLKNCIHGEGIPTVEAVVIESDWPEYEPVWKMIEDRVTGAPIEGGKAEYDAMAKAMTNDKTATMSRELAQLTLNAVEYLALRADDIGESNTPIAEELRAVLAQEAGPVVERQLEGPRERFQKWVLATEHPVLGFLDGHWLERGDDREGYANEYVQGLWVAFKQFTSPPAPVSVDEGTTSDKYRAELYDEVWQKARDMGFANVTDALSKLSTLVAVVLPERMTGPRKDFDYTRFSDGWNACLDKVKELNQ